MGKTEDDRVLRENSGDRIEASERNAGRRFPGCGCGRISGIFGLRCLLVLILSVVVFLSALFWLPPFHSGSDQGDPDLDLFKGHEIVASFNVKKPASILQENILQLEKDIFDEMSYASIKVVVLSIEHSAETNITKVVFAINPDTKYSEISPLSQSFIRESFESLVTNQTSLHLSKSLFGEPFLFEVLKFPGGITVIPPQSAFLLQKVQILFNFTLNFSIYQIQVNFNTLTSQLKKGLHLAPYENLYVRLSNSKGSTVSPPTTVQSSVLLTVGTPSMPRLKQLAQTITGSHSRNLGLNNTVFGRVKQVRLSSILQHSLGSDDSATSPSPSPLPQIQHPHHPHHHHHHHHHQNHRHHHDASAAPDISPILSPEKGPSAPPRGAPLPARSLPSPHRSPFSPKRSPFSPPPCQYGNKRRQRGNSGKVHSHLAPRVAPNFPPRYFASTPKQMPYPPAPSSARKSHLVPTSAPLPHVVFAHAQSPSRSESDKPHANEVASASPPSPSSSSSGSHSVQWAVFLLPLAALVQI